jgi:hypothetical protein
MQYKPYCDISLSPWISVILLVRDFNNRMEDYADLRSNKGTSAPQQRSWCKPDVSETQVVYAGSDDAVADWKLPSGWIKTASSGSSSGRGRTERPYPALLPGGQQLAAMVLAVL